MASWYSPARRDTDADIRTFFNESQRDAAEALAARIADGLLRLQQAAFEKLDAALTAGRPAREW